MPLRQRLSGKHSEPAASHAPCALIELVDAVLAGTKKTASSIDSPFVHN